MRPQLQDKPRQDAVRVLEHELAFPDKETLVRKLAGTSDRANESLEIERMGLSIVDTRQPGR